MNRLARRPKLDNLAIGAITAVLIAGCGGAPDTGPADESDGRSFAIVCGVSTTTDGDGQQSTVQEKYGVTAMNRKLRLHPDFAAFVGLHSVGGCAEARTFMTGYRAFSKTYPDILRDDPIDLTPPSPPPPPPGLPPDSSAQIPKIFAGDSNVVRQAIVQLAYPKPPDLERRCTGTFIARNWILTAAHCLPVTLDSPTGPFGDLIPLDGYQKLTVMHRLGLTQASVPIPSGDPNDPDQVWGYQYVHPSFVGTDGGGTAGTDLALVFLYPPWYDRFLNQHSDIGAMRILMNPPQVDQEFFAWGWGHSVDDDSAPSQLRVSQFAAIISDVDPDRFTVAADPPNDVRVCTGDSGGPAIRSVSLNLGVRDATFGVLSAGEGSDCVPIGGSEFWGRIDFNMPFVESRLKAWNGPKFTCPRFPLAAGLGTYARCWGDECTGDATCGTGRVCAGLDPANGVTFGQCISR